VSAKQVLEAWSRETITQVPYVSNDPYGQSVYGSPVTHRARIDYMSHLVQDVQGTERISSTQIYIATVLPFDVRDQITLPDGSQPGLIRVDRLADATGEPWCVTLYC
jgi:hypothetical protein